MIFFKRNFCFILIILGITVSNPTNANNEIMNQDTSKIDLPKFFAENYKPNNFHNTSPDELPVVSNEIRTAIYQNEVRSEKYLTLIILKLYRAHLECCNQSYELRKGYKLDSLDTPILFEFIKITKIYDLNNPIEFIPSSIAYNLVNKNKELLKYPPIKKEFDLIFELNK